MIKRPSEQKVAASRTLAASMWRQWHGLATGMDIPQAWALMDRLMTLNESLGALETDESDLSRLSGFVKGTQERIDAVLDLVTEKRFSQGMEMFRAILLRLEFLERYTEARDEFAGRVPDEALNAMSHSLQLFEDDNAELAVLILESAKKGMRAYLQGGFVADLDKHDSAFGERMVTFQLQPIENGKFHSPKGRELAERAAATEDKRSREMLQRLAEDAELDFAKFAVSMAESLYYRGSERISASLRYRGEVAIHSFSEIGDILTRVSDLISELPPQEQDDFAIRPGDGGLIDVYKSLMERKAELLSEEGKALMCCGEALVEMLGSVRLGKLDMAALFAGTPVVRSDPPIESIATPARTTGLADPEEMRRRILVEHMVRRKERQLPSTPPAQIDIDEEAKRTSRRTTAVIPLPDTSPRPAGPSGGGMVIRPSFPGSPIADMRDASQARLRAAIERGNPTACMVLQVMEYNLNLRSDLSPDDANDLLSRLETSSKKPAAKALALIAGSDGMLSIVRSLDAAERMMLVDHLVRSGGEDSEKALTDAFIDIFSYRGEPSREDELLRFAAEVRSSEAGRCMQRAAEECFGKQFRVALLLVNGHPEEGMRRRIAAEWFRARSESARQLSLAKAGETELDVGLEKTRKLLESRELDLGIADWLYTGGSTENLIEILYNLHIDVSPFSELNELANRKKGFERERMKRGLDRAVKDFFDLLSVGELESRISLLSGFEGQRCRGVRILGGVRGAFGLIMPAGKLLVKLDDPDAARLGMELAEARGLMTSRILSRSSGGEPLEYPTGLLYGDGSRHTQRFTIIEDIHDLVGKERPCRLPDGSLEKVVVESVAILDSEVLVSPDFGNPATRHFFSLCASEKGRAAVFKAWFAYQELSRRALLADRFPRNTALVVVRRGDGGLVATFQPVDMDPAGYLIANRPGSDQPRFDDFDADFGNATGRMLVDLLSSAGGSGLTMSALLREISGPEARSGSLLPPDEENASDRIFDRFDSIHASIGFDTADPGNASIKDVVQLFGRYRFIERADGRCLFYADEAKRVRSVNEHRQMEFMENRKHALARYLAERVVLAANKMADLQTMPPRPPGAEIAAGLAHSPDYAEADQPERLLMATQALLRMLG